MKAVRVFEVSVQGFSPVIYSARTPAKARAEAWRDYCSYDNYCTFRTFLGISTLRRAPEYDARLRRVLVCGKPATLLYDTNCRRNRFMWDGSNEVVNAHESEITELPIASPGIG